MKKAITTVNAPSAFGPYNQAIAVGKTVYISGQIGMDPKTSAFAGPTVEDQTHQVLKNIDAIIKEAGGNLSNIVKTTVLLKSMEDFTKVNEIYASYFKPPYPARACFEVARLPKDSLVEIEAIGHLE